MTEAEEPQFAYGDTVAELRSELSNTPVSAGSIVVTLLERRADYGVDRARDPGIRVFWENSVSTEDQRRRPFDEWLEEISAFYDPGETRILDGRLVILGLALLLPGILGALRQTGLFDVLWYEGDRPYESLLSPAGMRRLEELGMLQTASAIPDEPAAANGGGTAGGESGAAEPVARNGGSGSGAEANEVSETAGPPAGLESMAPPGDELLVEEAPASEAAEGVALEGSPAEAGAEPLRQARRLEAAMPESVRVNQTTELLVMLPRRGSQGLRAELPIETIAGESIDRDDVSEREAEILFPAPDIPRIVYVFVSASKHDFEVEDPFRGVLVYPDRDGDYETFYLTPLRPLERAPVTVRLFEDKERARALGTVRLSTTVSGHEGDAQLARLRETVAFAAASGPVTINYSFVGGDSIHATVSDSSGVALGRDAAALVGNQGSVQVMRLFTPLLALVAREALGAVQVTAIADVQALQEEVERGNTADDQRIAGLIQNIADGVPGAKPTIVALFAAPEIIITAGPVTRFVLGRLQVN